MDWVLEGEGEATVVAMVVWIKEAIKGLEGGLEATEVAGVLGSKKLEGTEGEGEATIVATAVRIMEALEGGLEATEVAGVLGSKKLEGTRGEEKFRTKWR